MSPRRIIVTIKRRAGLINKSKKLNSFFVAFINLPEQTRPVPPFAVEAGAAISGRPGALACDETTRNQSTRRIARDLFGLRA